MSSRAIAIAAAAGAAVIALVVFLSVMSDSAPRRTGTNSGLVPTHAIVPPKLRFCQRREVVPAGTGAVAPWVGGYAGAHGPPADARIYAGGRLIATGHSPPTYPTGITLFKLDRTVERETPGATVCFVNRGRRVLNVYGDFTSSHRVSAPAYADNRRVVARLDWYEPGSQTWWDTLGTIARRFPLVKAGFLGSWSMWAAVVAMLVLSVAAVVRVVREAPR